MKNALSILADANEAGLLKNDQALSEILLSILSASQRPAREDCFSFRVHIAGGEHSSLLRDA